ncbi:MAG: hypothetical protein ABFD82_00825 [Syntrophaceae bacterium]
MDERKKIDELVALYSVETGLKDVYVEGTRDKIMLDWFLMDQNILGISVYEVDAINVPNEVLDRHGLEHGSNRSRVLALSEELASQLPPDRKILCVVDRDYEDYLSSGHRNSFLAFTDYSSADLYLWRKRTIQKLISLVLGGFSLGTEQVMGDLVGVLEELFFMRLTNKTLGWGMTWISFVKYVQFDGHIIFAVDRFKKAYLQRNNRWDQRAQFDCKQKELKARLQEDPRRRMRGHDLMEALYHATKKLKSSRRFGDVETFQGAYTGCLETQDILNEPLFQRISAL